MVVPIEMPKICVCTAAATPLLHILLLIVVMLGLMAEGGGDSTLVLALLVDSVTMGCAIACLAVKPRQIAMSTAQMYRITFICV
jgi:hypothetical protein